MHTRQAQTAGDLGISSMKAHHLIRVLLPFCMCVLRCICVCMRGRLFACVIVCLTLFSLFTSLSLGLCMCLAVCVLVAVYLPQLPGCRVCIRAHVLFTSLCFCDIRSCIYTGLYARCVERKHDSIRFSLFPGSLAMFGCASALLRMCVVYLVLQQCTCEGGSLVCPSIAQQVLHSSRV